MKKFFLISFSLIIFSTYAQNTLSYTEVESHYNNGVELFEKKAYVAARKEFKAYVQKSAKSINPNQFNIANAEYYAAVSALHSQSKDADIEVERFVINYGEHPKAKIIYSDLGNSFFEKGEYESAIVYLNKALINRQDNLEVYELRYKLGISYYQLKKYQEALKDFDYVKGTVAPNALNAAYYAAVINFEYQNYDQALADLRRVENTNPYKIEVPNWIAQILYRQNKLDELISYAEPIIESPDGRKIDELCLVTAEVFYFRDNFEKAAKYYDRFRDFRRGIVDPQVTFRHAYSLYKINNFKKAVEEFKKIADRDDELGQQAAYYMGIAALNGGDYNAAQAAFDVAQSKDFDGQIKEAATFNYAKVLIEQKNNQEALNKLKKYVQTYPAGKYVDEANELLSEILFETNNYLAAIEYIESLSHKTAKLNEAYQKLCYNQGVHDFNLEKFDKSILYFDKAIDLPINKEIVLNAKFWKAEAAYATGKPDTESLYKDLLTNGSTEAKIKSLYSLGYIYYNQRNFSQAQKYFLEFINKSKSNAELLQNREDAVLRLADCHLIQKDFQLALKYYNEAIANNRTDKDYAYFQKGITLDLMGRKDEAKKVFENFSKTYENSRLIDDVLFNKGVLELEGNNYQAAVLSFSEMLRKRSNSVLVPEALLRRALAYSNLENYDKAIADYKLIASKFGNTSQANEALIGLRDVLNLTGRSEDFAEVVEDYQQNNPGSNSAINLQYEAARNLYYNEKYEAAINALNKFISTNPKNPNVMEATYLIGESYYFWGKKNDALKYYNQILADKQSTFLTKAALRSSIISYENADYRNAVSAYQEVLSSSTDKRDQVVAWEGLFKSYYFLGDYENAIKYANIALESGSNIVIGTENKAHLYLGKSYMQRRNFDEAKAEFLKTIDLAKDINGAEAQYFIGDMLTKAGKFDESILEMQKLSENFSEFIYWYEKAFLLIADNYIGKEDKFMAKATLNSIIENSDTPATVAEAKSKLKNIN